MPLFCQKIVKTERGVSQLARVYWKNVVFLHFQNVKSIFPKLLRFCVFKGHFHQFSPYSSSPPLLSSPLLFSSLPFPSLLSPLMVVSSLSCVVVVFFFCLVRCCFVAAGRRRGSCVFLSGCFSFHIDFLNFCIFSLSFRPLLNCCQVHSARRVACT